MSAFLKTKSSRALLVLLGLMVSGSIGAWYLGGPTHVSPTDFYYWTEEFSNIEVDAYPKITWPMYGEGRRKLRERCNVSAGGPAISGSEWRDVQLCNAANLDKDDFEVAHNKFKARVDEDYSKFYGGTARDLVGFIFVALISWCFLSLGWRIYRWVVAAPVKPSI
jgi:hypothetical protein